MRRLSLVEAYPGHYRIFMRIVLFLILVAGPAPAQAPALTDERIDQLTAPIALYPDALLSQVLMASTYPDDVAQAAAWSRQRPTLGSDEATEEAASEPWDPSVQSLVAFPQVLAMMEQEPDWVRALGQAFLAQPDAVMNSVQRLRAMAQESGNLESNQQQLVESDQSIIIIEPANPEIFYVPSYDPSVAYGAWPYPAYPPVFVPLRRGHAVHHAMRGHFDWHRHDVVDMNQRSWTKNNQARIEQARANTRYRRTAAPAPPAAKAPPAPAAMPPPAPVAKPPPAPVAKPPPAPMPLPAPVAKPPPAPVAKPPGPAEKAPPAPVANRRPRRSQRRRQRQCRHLRRWQSRRPRRSQSRQQRLPHSRQQRLPHSRRRGLLVRAEGMGGAAPALYEHTHRQLQRAVLQPAAARIGVHQTRPLRHCRRPRRAAPRHPLPAGSGGALAAGARSRDRRLRARPRAAPSRALFSGARL
jgi:hypothetical protein